MKIKRVLFSILLVLLLSVNANAYITIRLGPEYFPQTSIGRPVSSADIYVGIPDTDPEIVANQQTLYVQQEDGTIVAVAQPISTGAGGVPLYLGSPVVLLAEGNYSLKVLNKTGVQIYYVPNVNVASDNPYFDYCTPGYLAVDQGAVGALTTIKSCIDTLGANNGTILFKHDSGGATTTYTLSTDETIPTNVSLEIEKGSIISIDTGKTLTINSFFKAEAYKVFNLTGTGVVVFGGGNLKEYYTEWWGALGDGSTDDYTAIRAAYTCALNSKGGIIQFLGKRYVIDSVIEIGLAGNLDVPIVFQGVTGSREEGTILQMDAIATGHALFEQNQGAYVYKHRFRDFSINGAIAGSEVVGDGDAFRIAYLNDVHFDNLYITSCNSAFTVTNQDVDRVTIKRSYFAGNAQDVIFLAAGASYHMSFESVQFYNTKEGASVEFKNGSRPKITTFRNCSWISCGYENVKSEAGSNIFEMFFDNIYSELGCATGGDYAYDFLSGHRNLSFRNSDMYDNGCAEAVVHLVAARNYSFYGCSIGLDNTTRAMDLGTAVGVDTIYGLILIGNVFYDDAAGDTILVLNNANVRQITSISNWPSLSTMEIPTVFEVSNYYVDSLKGTTFVPRLNAALMTGHETFTAHDGMTFKRDAGGVARNFNPTGSFITGHMIFLDNYGGETITFDSAGINVDVATTEKGIFYYDGAAWRAFMVGIP